MTATGGAGLPVTVAGRAHALVAGTVLRVGRDPECDIAVNDFRISRRHLVIEEAAGGGASVTWPAETAPSSTDSGWRASR